MIFVIRIADEWNQDVIWSKPHVRESGVLPRNTIEILDVYTSDYIQ